MDPVKVTHIDIRGTKLPVYFDPRAAESRQLTADLDGAIIYGSSLEDLAKKAMAKTRRRAAKLNIPFGVHYADGRLYIADTGNSVIRTVLLP